MTVCKAGFRKEKSQGWGDPALPSAGTCTSPAIGAGTELGSARARLRTTPVPASPGPPQPRGLPSLWPKAPCVRVLPPSH